MTEEMSQTAAGGAAIRLQKYLAEAGVASRRSCEQLILDGRVQVNGTVVTQLGTKIVPGKDEIVLDGKLVLLEEEKQYILLYKPVGVLSSASDDRGRKTVIDLLTGVAERVYPVGRLDYDTEGLLLLTNDGALTHFLIHPCHEIEKTYLATIDGTPSTAQLHQLAKGILLSDGMTAPAKVKLVKSRGAHTLLEITIHEGRNRQVRRMCAAIGHPVQALKRVQMGPITLGDLQVGQWRYLTMTEVAALWNNKKKKNGAE